VDALDVLKVCLRRWYVVLPIVLLSLAAGIGLASQQKPIYTAFGSYALIYHSSGSTKDGSDPTEKNPLATNGAVVLGEALVADFMSGASQETFGGVGNSGTAPREPEDGTSYSVSVPDGSQSYVVQTWGTDPESLRTVVESVLAAAPLRAAQIQDRAGAPERSQYTTFVTGSAQLSKLPLTSTPKLIVAMLGVGILAGSALALVVDRLVRSRKNRAAGLHESRSPSVDEPAMPPDAYDAATITRLPTSGTRLSTSGVGPAQPYENKTEYVRAEQLKLESDLAAGFDGAGATKGATEQVHAGGPTEISPHQTEVGPQGQADEAVVGQSEEVSGSPTAEAPARQPAEAPADQTAEVLADRTVEVFADQDHEPPADPDNGSWPLLEHDRELEAEGATNHNTRDRQPAH
jgi:hypothetical protein